MKSKATAAADAPAQKSCLLQDGILTPKSKSNCIFLESKFKDLKAVTIKQALLAIHKFNK